MFNLSSQNQYSQAQDSQSVGDGNARRHVSSAANDFVSFLLESNTQLDGEISTRPGTEIQYKTRAGELKSFCVTAEACRPFGFYTGQRVNTCRGPAWVVGVNGGELYWHIDGDPGASKWTGHREAEFIQRKFSLLSTPMKLPDNRKTLYFGAMVNNPSYSDVTFLLEKDVDSFGFDLSLESRSSPTLQAAHTPFTSSSSSSQCREFLSGAQLQRTTSRNTVASALSNNVSTPSPMVSPAPLSSSFSTSSATSVASQGQARKSFSASSSSLLSSSSSPAVPPMAMTMANVLEASRGGGIFSPVSSASNTHSVLQRPQQRQQQQQQQQQQQESPEQHVPLALDVDCASSSSASSSLLLPLSASSSQRIPIYGHKVILCSASEYFRAMFGNKMTQETTHREVIINGVSAATFLEIMRFLYTDAVSLTDIPMAAALLRAADMFVLDSLKERCASLLADRVSDKEVLPILALAETFGLNSLKNLCMSYAFDQMDSAALQEELHTFVETGKSSLVCELVIKAVAQGRKRSRTSASSSNNQLSQQQ